MDGVLGFAALIGIGIVIYFFIWLKDKVVDGITTGVTTGINRVVQSGNHQLGKEMTAEEIQATSTAPPGVVISTVLEVLDLPDHRPTTVSAGLFAIRAEDDGILFGAGGMLGVSFTAMMVVEKHDEGSSIGYTVVEWKIENGVIAHAKLMSTLSEGVRFALGQLPGVSFAIAEGAGPSEEGTSALRALSQSAPDMAPSAGDSDASALADPLTEAAVLADIAARRNDLWNQILGHPSVYPDLRQWIESQEPPATAAPPDDADVRALASSDTEPLVLADIAARRPELWSDVARHPAAYPDLLAWISQHGGVAVGATPQPEGQA